MSPFRLSFPPPLGVFSQLPTTHCSRSTLFPLSPSCPERSRGVSTAFLRRAKPRGTTNRSLTPLSAAFLPRAKPRGTQTHQGVGGQSPLPSHSSSLRTLYLCGKSRIFILLHTLYLSCRSFFGSRPLFSIVCALFDKKHAYMRTAPVLGCTPQRGSASPFRINTCKSVSKQETLSTCTMNTYAKPRGEGGHPTMAR